jgi:lipoate-protein ligase A
MVTMIPWKLLDTGAATGAHNMALDQELLARAQAGDSVPVLRFYAWHPPAVSLGRFQNAEIAVNAAGCKRLGIDIVRRITGGRAVLHHKELTYSVIARSDNPLFPPDVLGTYKIISAGLVAGLKNLGIPAEVVSRGGRHAALVRKDAREPACFSSPSWYEILVRDRKIIGSAQRRLSAAFLQHGSVLLDYDPGLEAEVIPGGSAGDVVTSVKRELGRELSPEIVQQALARGFSAALDIEFAR